MKNEFTRTSNGETYLNYAYYRIQDKEMCKISNKEQTTNEKI